MEHRSPKHVRDSKSALCNAFRLYGLENFDFQILEECDNEDILPKREIFWIKKLKPSYNISLGGKGNLGYKHTDETKSILSNLGRMQWDRKTEEEKNRIIKNNFKSPAIGHVVSKETREKISRKLQGTVLSSETRRKISNANKISLLNNKNGNKRVVGIKDGEKVIFNSVKEAAESIGVDPTCITGVLKGKRKTSGGFRWFYWGVETNGDECSRVGVSLSHTEVRDNQKG